MKNRHVSKQLLAVTLAVSMIFGAAPAVFAEERIDAESIKEDNLPSADAAEAETDAEAETEASEIRTEYPLTITTYDYEGNEVETTYEKAPEKVLAIYQGSIETMLEPDMILSWGSIFADDRLGDVTNWIEKDCNTFINTNTRKGGTRTLENEYNDILNLGKIFDVQDKAETIVNEMKATVEKATAAAADLESKPSVLILEPLSEDITNYGASSLGGDMITALGAELANPDASTVGKEDIIAANPDIIFVVYMPYAGDDPETVMNNQLSVITDDEAFQSLDAVKNKTVYPIMLSEMYASATRTQSGIETFAQGLYPDVVLD